YIIENNNSKIIDNDTSDNEVESINEDEVNENEANTKDWYNDLIKWIISDNQSFVVVENIFFQTMIKRLNNIAKIPSADTISNKIINIFNYKQDNLQKNYKEIPGKISFTLDTWTSKNQKSFIEVTAH
ncbi:44748_t:CDS:2, partial [Gigaspora margarita]